MQTIRLKREKLPYEINEELKVLRTNLLFCGAEKRVFLMTSAFSGEGKSTIAYDLCLSLAELGKNVILIDGDMRKSTLKHKINGTVPENGLSHYLSSQCERDDVICQTDIDQFYMVLAGATPPNPTELLASDNMRRLINYCREYFDYVVVDCPPVGLVVDAAVLAPNCDGSMMLIESNQVKYRLAQECVAKMKATGCPILGVVLNKVSEKKYGRYYTKYYGKKYYKAYYAHADK
ncbi:MAG: CpsD/CapB family tyrosine-protein kinase [Oscillospiraceae bacterium]|nr:CpsD/CapB family tyrosine-protein kinase [Oscillospiraceae bacterium]